MPGEIYAEVLYSSRSERYMVSAAMDSWGVEVGTHLTLSPVVSLYIDLQREENEREISTL